MLLAVDTSTRNIGISLYSEGSVLSEMSWSSPNYHTVELAPAVQLMLAKSHITSKDLKAAGVAIGPGSYTGLRIGLAFVKGLALSQHIPLVGVPTLDVLALSQPISSLSLAAVLEAGRKRMSVGWYRVEHGSWLSTGQLENLNTDEFVDAIQEPTWICGELTDRVRTRLRQLGKNVQIASPAQSVRRAAFLAEIAWNRWQAGKADDPATLAPEYLHTGSPIPG